MMTYDGRCWCGAVHPDNFIHASGAACAYRNKGLGPMHPENPGDPEYEVIEKIFSWGTCVKLYREGKLVMFVDVYRNGSYRVYEKPW